MLKLTPFYIVAIVIFKMAGIREQEFWGPCYKFTAMNLLETYTKFGTFPKKSERMCPLVAWIYM